MNTEPAAAPLQVQIRRLPNGTQHNTPLPRYQTDHAAGMDIHACLAGPVTLAPSEIAMIPAGFAMAVPVGYEAQVRPRSGLATKHGVTLPNAPGTIDADYRGEVKVPLINLGPAPVIIEPDMRIAQMLIAPVPRVAWQEVDELPETQRGKGGFGHTGR
ncbi:MAG: dUTP diphosphatase [Planctomycetota bacterium]